MFDGHLRTSNFEGKPVENVLREGHRRLGFTCAVHAVQDHGGRRQQNIRDDKVQTLESCSPLLWRLRFLSCLKVVVFLQQVVDLINAESDPVIIGELGHLQGLLCWVFVLLINPPRPFQRRFAAVVGDVCITDLGGFAKVLGIGLAK